MGTGNPHLPGHGAEDFDDLDALRAQDRTAFSRLVKMHHKALVAVARGMVGDNDADEVVQKAWLKAFEGIKAFEGRARLRTWLTTIVMNEGRMLLRSRKNRPLDNAASIDDPLGDRFDQGGAWRESPFTWSATRPEDTLMADELAACLAKTMAALTGQQRAVLELRDVQEQELGSIARELGLSEGNVRVLLHRARGHLYAAVERYEMTGQC